jgi:uncharacterized delta-60 repeat protein
MSVIAFDLSHESTWGGPADEEATDMAVARDGSVYVTGTTLSFGAGDRDAFLLKYSPDGSLEWQRTYGTAVAQPLVRPADFGQGVAAAADGSVYITGQLAGGNLFLVKFDAAGHLLWQRTWGGSGNFGIAVGVAADGSVYVAGGTFTFGAGQGDALLLKFTPDGLLEWAQTWGGVSRESLTGMAIAADGGIYLIGDTSSFFWNDAFLVKFAADGALLWQRDWGTMGAVNPNDTNAWGVGTADDGSVYIAGTSTTLAGSMIVAKFDAAGTLLWQRVAAPAFGAGFDIAAAADGTVYVTGYANVETEHADTFVITLLPSGKAREAMTWGGTESEIGASIAVAPDGSILVAGNAGAPPYAMSRVRPHMRIPDAFVITPGGIVSTPEAASGIPLGVVTAPTGSTTFGGGTDAMLLRVQP